jgi:hypothetical protein
MALLEEFGGPAARQRAGCACLHRTIQTAVLAEMLGPTVR